MPTAPVLPAGLRASAVSAGIYKRERLDLALLVAEEPIPAAAMFTQSRLLGAHVPICREKLAESRGRVRALLVNAGNANCATGSEGLALNRRVADALAAGLGARPEEVLFLSTGVIGARLPAERILDALGGLIESADSSGLDAFSRAILTTDTRPKVVSAELGEAHVLGIAKGSGMIHPNMATMFGFLLTDAQLGSDGQAILRRVADRSFHRVTVDGDTSPNDTVLLLATGAVERPATAAMLEPAATELARAIARDGEGATRLVTVRVQGAPDEIAAARVARTIATSPLVKTAVAGRDPNWGRILAAAARAGVAFEPSRTKVWIGPGVVFAEGVPHPDNEAAAHTHLANDSEVVLGIDLAAGDAAADAWTCDFTADYVRINADYRS